MTFTLAALLVLAQAAPPPPPDATPVTVDTDTCRYAGKTFTLAVTQPPGADVYDDAMTLHVVQDGRGTVVPLGAPPHTHWWKLGPLDAELAKRWGAAWPISTGADSCGKAELVGFGPSVAVLVVRTDGRPGMDPAVAIAYDVVGRAVLDVAYLDESPTLVERGTGFLRFERLVLGDVARFPPLQHPDDELLLPDGDRLVFVGPSTATIVDAVFLLRLVAGKFVVTLDEEATYRRGGWQRFFPDAASFARAFPDVTPRHRPEGVADVAGWMLLGKSARGRACRHFQPTHHSHHWRTGPWYCETPVNPPPPRSGAGPSSRLPP